MKKNVKVHGSEKEKVLKAGTYEHLVKYEQLEMDPVKNYGIYLYKDDDVTMIYEGEFQNGVHHGKVREYYLDSEECLKLGVEKKDLRLPLRFEGTYKNGFRHGHGVLYDEDGSVFYEGDFSEGLPNVKVKGNKKEKVLIAGRYKDGTYSHVQMDPVKNNYGIHIDIHHLAASIYEGEFQNGVYHGEGREYYKHYYLSSEGCLKLDDEKKEISLPLRFEGTYENGFRHGHGVLYNEDGSVFYKGDFSKGAVVDSEVREIMATISYLV